MHCHTPDGPGSSSVSPVVRAALFSVMVNKQDDKNVDMFYMTIAAEWTTDLGEMQNRSLYRPVRHSFGLGLGVGKQAVLSGSAYATSQSCWSSFSLPTDNLN